MARVERCAAIMAATVGAVSVAYACCYYKADWSQDPAPCEGDYTYYCEDSSPNCTAPASGSDYSCLITGDQRWARCYKITLGAGGAFLKGDCNTHPGTEWTLVARLPDGSCCWAKHFNTPEITEPTYPYMVNICQTICVAVP